MSVARFAYLGSGVTAAPELSLAPLSLHLRIAIPNEWTNSMITKDFIPI